MTWKECSISRKIERMYLWKIKTCSLLLGVSRRWTFFRQLIRKLSFGYTYEECLCHGMREDVIMASCYKTYVCFYDCLCNLCLEEKPCIMKADKKYLLNKRAEIFSKCRHKNKHKIYTMKPWWHSSYGAPVPHVLNHIYWEF